MNPRWEDSAPHLSPPLSGSCIVCDPEVSRFLISLGVKLTRSRELAQVSRVRPGRASWLSRELFPSYRRILQESGAKKQAGAGTMLAPLRNRTTMMRATERFGILVWLALLLALHVSAQSVQPTLEDTMTFIANTLNSRGIVSWTTTDQDLAGAKWTTASSLAQVNADPSTCSLAWTNIKIQSPDKTVETYLVQLRVVSGVNVQSHSRSSASQSGDKLQFSPDTYLLQIRTTTAISGHRQSYKKDKLKSTTNLPNDRAAEIQFADEQTAARVAEAIRRAAGLCGATQSPL